MNIYNCYLLSQVSYIGTILDPSSEQLKKIYSLIHQFISSNDRIGSQKLYSTIESGGLGLINIEDFLFSIRVAFFKRSFPSNDSWATNIKEARVIPSNPFIINIDHPSLVANPFSRLFTKAYQIWAGHFANWGQYFKFFPIFFNKHAFQLNKEELTPYFSNRKDYPLLSLIPCQLIDFDNLIPWSMPQMETQIGRKLNLV